MAGRMGTLYTATVHGGAGEGAAGCRAHISPAHWTPFFYPPNGTFDQKPPLSFLHPAKELCGGNYMAPGGKHEFPILDLLQPLHLGHVIKVCMPPFFGYKTVIQSTFYRESLRTEREMHAANTKKCLLPHLQWF